MSSKTPARSASQNAVNEDPQRPASRRAKAGYLALFVLLALVAAQTARLGVAGFFVQMAQRETDQTTPGTRGPGAAEVSRIAKNFADGLDWAADNPWALEGAGAMGLARMRASKLPREALAATREAGMRFRQGLRQRPTSSFLWANLALTKLYLNEIDGELLAALRHADELGPWEQTVQQTTLFVGLAVWQDLDPDLRRAMVRTLERGVSRDPVKLYEIVKSYTRLDLVCAIPKYKLIAGSDCRKLVETSLLPEPKDKGNGQ